MTAYVTGGGQGIGRVCALGLAQAGARVAVIDLLADNARAVRDEIRTAEGQSVALGCDVTDSAQVESALDEVEKELGPIDIAFNNAGIAMHASAVDTSDDDWRRIMSVDLDGVFYGARAAAKRMINARRGGSIINTASMSAHIVNYPQPQAPYNAAKAGVVQLTRSLAAEWAPRNIRVNCISPGYTSTEMVNDAIRKAPEWEKVWLDRSPMGRLARPDEIVGPVVFLASPAASFVTGHDLVIDGGFTCW